MVKSHPPLASSSDNSFRRSAIPLLLHGDELDDVVEDLDLEEGGETMTGWCTSMRERDRSDDLELEFEFDDDDNDVLGLLLERWILR